MEEVFLIWNKIINGKQALKGFLKAKYKINPALIF